MLVLSKHNVKIDIFSVYKWEITIEMFSFILRVCSRWDRVKMINDALKT